MTVEDDRDNSPLEEQVFGVILLVPLFAVSFDKHSIYRISKLSLSNRPALKNCHGKFH
jgi:hypothetical protein